jgi:hypothetical protein
MFAVTPYAAQRQRFIKNENGGLDCPWEPCRVIGITKDEDGEPAYLVEFKSGGEFMLAVETYIRKLP